MDNVQELRELIEAAVWRYDAALESGLGVTQARTVVMNTLFHFRREILKALKQHSDLDEEIAMLNAALVDADARLDTQDIQKEIEAPRKKGGRSHGIGEAGNQK